jgi:hypothetical protein
LRRVQLSRGRFSAVLQIVEGGKRRVDCLLGLLVVRTGLSER